MLAVSLALKVLQISAQAAKPVSEMAELRLWVEQAWEIFFIVISRPTRFDFEYVHDNHYAAWLVISSAVPIMADGWGLYSSRRAWEQSWEG